MKGAHSVRGLLSHQLIVLQMQASRHELTPKERVQLDMVRSALCALDGESASPEQKLTVKEFFDLRLQVYQIRSRT